VRDNADGLLRRVGRDRARVDRRGKLYFVEAGPYPTQADADAARAALARNGFTGHVRTAPRS
jgi:cell division protein FtsN